MNQLAGLLALVGLVAGGLYAFNLAGQAHILGGLQLLCAGLGAFVGFLASFFAWALIGKLFGK